MTWFKVDDNLAHHWKVTAAGNAAMGLWVRAGAWSMQNLTDGHIPTHVLRTLGTRHQAERLVWAGLWNPDPLDGYRFHQFNERGRQPERQKVEYEREQAQIRLNRHRGKDSGRFERGPALPRDDRANDAQSRSNHFLSAENSAAPLDDHEPPDEQ